MECEKIKFLEDIGKAEASLHLRDEEISSLRDEKSKVSTLYTQAVEQLSVTQTLWESKFRNIVLDLEEMKRRYNALQIVHEAQNSLTTAEQNMQEKIDNLRAEIESESERKVQQALLANEQYYNIKFETERKELLR